MQNNFYSKEELKQIGFKKIGENVLISKKTSIYNPQEIEIKNNVRIDDFVILSGKIKIGNYVHISIFCAIQASNIGIDLEDFCGLAPSVFLFSSSDDYFGNYMTNAMVPDEYRNVRKGKIEIKKHVIIGANSVILPGIILEEGTAIAAMSLVNRSTEGWYIYSGNPIKKIFPRSKGLLKLAKNLE